MTENAAVSAKPSLRDRKKARRRDEIIKAARELFAQQGIDATTMAEIAAAAEVSPPTVFNYFGSKDGILVAMITEGTKDAREMDRGKHLRPGADLTTLITELFLRVTTRTLEVAGKRVWRYAEAAAIRHPGTDLAREFHNVSVALHEVIVEVLSDIALETRAGTDCPRDYLARILIDLWMPLFIQLITAEDMSPVEYETTVRARFEPLIGLIFTDACATAPTLVQHG
ncbi:TetR/AcrR family transcriptional regulator [Sagittula stellata]|uniref:HTH tetR-type domain-containing protein n=1 Tax=Sagittula stellata (strain ATCC 700073 / DSM 11524 / E-37) TaxID=388399 RepID=A3K7P3_SAGS3|nr:TetR/AcrR family transcriptional regulator [Sagittula stellata]EBA06665.1 hypothetical protein SSE37_02220 [Sagittula stellata E-37]